MGKKINRLKKELAEMESEIKSCMRGRDYCKKKVINTITELVTH